LLSCYNNKPLQPENCIPEACTIASTVKSPEAHLKNITQDGVTRHALDKVPLYKKTKTTKDNTVKNHEIVSIESDSPKLVNRMKLLGA
jgi:hypothetical protein